MAEDGQPVAYLVLGPAGAGRRALVADLLEGGFPERQ